MLYFAKKCSATIGQGKMGSFVTLRHAGTNALSPFMYRIYELIFQEILIDGLLFWSFGHTIFRVFIRKKTIPQVYEKEKIPLPKTSLYKLILKVLETAYFLE